MIHCADRANAQRTRMPDAVRAELYVTPGEATDAEMGTEPADDEPALDA
jgi:hypothetical protein